MFAVRASVRRRSATQPVACLAACSPGRGARASHGMGRYWFLLNDEEDDQMRKFAIAALGPAALLALSAGPLAAQDAAAPPPPASEPAAQGPSAAEAPTATDAAAPATESAATDAAATPKPKARGGKKHVGKDHPDGHAPAAGSGER